MTPLPPKPPTAAVKDPLQEPAPKRTKKADTGTPEFPRSTEEEKAQFATGFGGKPRKPVPSASSPSTRKLQTKLEELFGSLALPFAMAGDTHCAGIIAQRTPALAEAWADLAEQNAGVKRVLTKLTEGSAWGGVILSTAAVALPIAQHHGLGSKVGDPFGFIFGSGASSTVPPRSSDSDSQRGKRAPVAASGSVAGAPSPPKQGTAPDYVPVVEDSPPGVVLVGSRNRANGGSPYA